MNTLVIKRLIEQYTLVQLMKAEKDIANQMEAEITVEGNDPGEQFSYLYAAIQVLDAMQAKDIAFKDALRVFSAKVRAELV